MGLTRPTTRFLGLAGTSARLTPEARVWAAATFLQALANMQPLILKELMSFAEILLWILAVAAVAGFVFALPTFWSR